MRILKQMYPDQDAGSQAIQKESKTLIEGLENVDIPDNLLNENNQEEKKEDTPTPEPSDNVGEPEKGQLPPEFSERYKDKSSDDLLKILYESQKQIGKLGQKLGDTKEDPLTEARKSISDLNAEVEKLKKTIAADYDEYDKDTDEYKKHQRELEKKEKKIKELKDREQELLIAKLVNKTVYDSHNKEFLKQQRSETAKSLGMETIEDEIWDDIADYAQHIAGTGERLTTEDIQAATIKKLGYANYNKIITTQAKLNVREEISKATSKTVTNVGGKPSPTIRFNEMSDAQHAKVLDYLYATDKAKYNAYAERLVQLRNERE